MRLICSALLLSLASCSNNDGAVSLGRMGGAPPRLILTSDLQAAGGVTIGSVVVTEEVQADRIVIRASGMPEGKHPVSLHPAGQCSSPGAATADALPPLEAAENGVADLYADIPGPRLRGTPDARLDADGFAVIVSIAGQRFACAAFSYQANQQGESGAIDGD